MPYALPWSRSLRRRGQECGLGVVDDQRHAGVMDDRLIQAVRAVPLRAAWRYHFVIIRYGWCMQYAGGEHV